MKKNAFLLLCLAVCSSAMAQTPKTPKFKLVTTQFSKGLLPGREYIQLIVDGKNTCSETAGGDSIADLRGIVIYDKNGDSVYIKGTDTTPGIASGKYSFPNTPTWDSISFGSIILIYNDRDKNNTITSPEDSLGIFIPHLYVIPARWLQLADSSTKPSKDSILPTPPSLNMKEGQYAYLISPIDSPYINDPANWKDTTVSAKLETPGSFNTQPIINWRSELLTPATKPFSVSLNIYPSPKLFLNGRIVTNYLCPRVIDITASSTLPDSSINYNWSLNNSILQNTTDTFYRVLHQNDSVVLTTSTNLKCVSGNVHSVTKAYYASNIYPDAPTVFVNILADSSKPWIDTLGRDAFGNIDSTIVYKTFNIGSATKLSAVTNHSGPTDFYFWMKNGITVSYDSIYYDSSISNRDTIYCILMSSLHCVSKPYDTTTIILSAANPVVMPAVQMLSPTQYELCMPPFKDSIRFTAMTDSALGAGSAPKFLWYLNGVKVPDNEIINILNGGSYISTYTNNGTLRYGSDTIGVRLINTTDKYFTGSDTSALVILSLTTFIPYPPYPSVNILGSPPLCAAGLPNNIPFTVAGSGNQGIHPTYQWFLNGKLVSDSTTWIDSNLVNNDSVTLIMTSSVGCAMPNTTSTGTKIILYPALTPAVTIPDSTLTYCANNPPTITPTPLNGGLNPTYYWYKVGINGNPDSLLGSSYGTFNFPTIIDFTDSLNWKVFCVMTSNASCVTTPIATSDTIAVTILPNPYVAPIVGASSVCVGAYTTLTDATPYPYGLWVTVSQYNATVNPLGDVLGINTGQAIIIYTVGNAYRCFTSVNASIEIYPSDVPFINGDSILSIGKKDTLTIALGGGSWGSSNKKVAVVDNNGIVTGISYGSVTITDTIVNDCGTTVRAFNVMIPYPVPVSLKSFTATADNKNVVTNWQTTTELNTNHFIIQHSTDGSAFTDIGTVKAKGSGANSYSFTDNNPTPSLLNGVVYYRLQSVDKDGASTYSAVVSCQWLVVSKQFTVYPNPAKDYVTIRGSHIASVQVIDNMGRVVKVVSLKDASNPVLSVSSLAAGVYHLRIQTTDGKVSGVGFVKE